MRIVISLTAIVAGASITFLSRILPLLADLGSEREYMALFSRTQHRVHLGLPRSFHIQGVSFPAPLRLWGLLWEQSNLPVWLARGQADTLVAPTEFVPQLVARHRVHALNKTSRYQLVAFKEGIKIRIRCGAPFWVALLYCMKRVAYLAKFYAVDRGKLVGWGSDYVGPRLLP